MGTIVIPREQRYMLLPRGWDDGWKAGQLAAASSPQHVLVFGDSISCHNRALEWSTYLRDIIRSRFPWYGQFWPMYDSADFFTTAVGSTYQGTPPVVLNSIANRVWNQPNGLLNYQSRFNNAAGGDVTFTSQNPCTQLEWIGTEAVAGTFDFSVDGGAAQTRTTTPVGTGYRKVVVSTGLASGIHTLRGYNQSATNVMIPDGFMEIADPTKGMGYARLAYPGARVDYFRDETGSTLPVDKCRQYQGRQADGTAIGLGFPFQPCLTIVALGINDAQGSVTMDNFRLTFGRLLQALRRGYPNASVLIVGMSNPDADSSEVTSNNFIGYRNWWQYLASMIDIAESYSCGFINIHAMWGNRTVTAGYHLATNPHPIAAGQTAILASVRTALGL